MQLIVQWLPAQIMREIVLLDNLQRNLCVYKMVNDWREEHIDGTRQKIQDKECKPQIEIKNS